MAKKTTRKSAGTSASKSPAMSADLRFVILHGKDTYQQADLAADLRRALGDRFGEIDTVRFEGGPATVGEVLDECRTFGLMAPHKLVVVVDAENFVNESSRPALERYAQDPSEQATLVLRANRWYPGKLDKLVAAAGDGTMGAVRKCEPMSEPKAAAWARDIAERKHDVSLDMRAAATLVELLGAELGRIDTEIAKLAVLAGDSKAITPQLVHEHVGRTREDSLWAIQGPILTSPEAGVAHMRAATMGGAKDEAVPLSWACLDLASKLHAAARLRARGVPDEGIAKTLRLWGDSKAQILGASRGLTPQVAARVLDAAVETDRAIKSVSSGRVASLRALEGLVIRLGTLAARSRRQPARRPEVRR
jgi:DNA polymerase-3 subunit delta